MYRQVLQFDPAHPDALHLLGVLAQQVGKHAAALSFVREAIKVRNDVAKYYLSLGEAYRGLGDNTEAIAAYKQAARLSPNFAEAHKSLGVALQNVGRVEDAIVSYERAIQCRPGYPEAYLNRACAWLSQGKFVQGWKEYDTWRAKTQKSHGARTEPEWDGSPLAGRTLLIEAEPNLDNTLQFIRYVRVLEEQQGKVFVEVHPSVMPLLTESGYSNLVPYREPAPRCDVRTSLLRLPYLCGTTLETIPTPIPYLSVRPELIDHWRRELAALEDFKVGIHWQGQPMLSTQGPWRSVGMASAEPLARLDGVQLISLRDGFGAEQVLGLDHKFPVLDLVERLDLQDGAMLNTAAVMSVVDLVITSDSAVAHLAGALGLKVWVALSYSANWRWMNNRADSPWYPTMRLFRQSLPAAWSGVFQEMAAELANLLKSGEAQR